MGAAEHEEQSGIIDSKDIIDKGNGDIEETELSKSSGLNGEQGEGEPESRPSPEETNLTTERPVGLEEDRVVQSQEKAAVELKKEVKDIPIKEDSFRKLSDQLSKHFQASKIASDKTRDTLEQIQKQLRQIDKIAASGSRQQIVVKQLAVQTRVIQKQLDKVNKANNRFRSTSSTQRKNYIKSKSKIKAKK